MIRRLATIAAYAGQLALAFAVGGVIMFASIPSAYRNHAPAIIIREI